jgi:uncharacterized paraquat-inducible protein A
MKLTKSQLKRIAAQLEDRGWTVRDNRSVCSSCNACYYGDHKYCSNCGKKLRAVPDNDLNATMLDLKKAVEAGLSND